MWLVVQIPVLAQHSSLWYMKGVALDVDPDGTDHVHGSETAGMITRIVSNCHKSYCYYVEWYHTQMPMKLARRKTRYWGKTDLEECKKRYQLSIVYVVMGTNPVQRARLTRKLEAVSQQSSVNPLWV